MINNVLLPLGYVLSTLFVIHVKVLNNSMAMKMEFEIYMNK